MRDFLHDEAFEGHDRILNSYLKPDLLILDDMGMKQRPKKSGEFLFEIIMRRHELRSTMMTSNRPLKDWGKLIGDVPAATAILDRFLQDAELIQITGAATDSEADPPIQRLAHQKGPNPQLLESPKRANPANGTPQKQLKPSKNSNLTQTMRL